MACDVGPLSPLPAIPPPVGMDAWAIEVMGLYEIAGGKVSAFRKCLADLRGKGVIR